MNMSLFHKEPVIEYKLEFLNEKNINLMKLLNQLKIKMKSLNENGNIECK